MSEISCEFCSSKFANKYILEKHKKTAKFCLKLQNKRLEEIKAEFVCEYCNKEFLIKYQYDSHLNHCKSKSLFHREHEEQKINKIKDENVQLHSIIEKQKFEIELYKTKQFELENKMKEKDEYYNEKLKEKDEYYNDKIKYLQESYDKFINENKTVIKSIENLATEAIKNTGHKTTINQKNKVINNLLPLTDTHLKEQSQLLQRRHIVNGAESLAYFAKEHSLKDRVICTDVARRNFIFKDETGILMKDPKGVKITKKFIENNKEELCRLLKEYALLYYDDNCPYEYKDKVEIDDCLYAVQNGDIPSNSDNYTKFERQFTTCFSKLVYNNNYIEEIEEKDD